MCRGAFDDLARLDLEFEKERTQSTDELGFDTVNGEQGFSSFGIQGLVSASRDSESTQDYRNHYRR